VSSFVHRTAALAALATRDALAARSVELLPRPSGDARGALERAIAWLCRTHDVTDRRGSSKGFSLVRGWLPAYPETTGYVIGTLIAYAERSGQEGYAERAREMGDWEVEVQQGDGGVIEGTVGPEPRPSIVFNTGMVLHGWIDLIEAGERRFEGPARRAARFLTDKIGGSGTWAPAVEYAGMPHTYNSRVAWAMLRWAEYSGEADVSRAALRHLDWVLSMQRANGWFESCIFRPGTLPSTHAIAYTLRGLLESYALVGGDHYLQAVRRTSEALVRKLETTASLPANFDAEWVVRSEHACLTGTVQLGGVWLRLHEVDGDARHLNAGLKAIDQVVARQERTRWTDISGAIAGSFPIWGRYAPLQYPNWATKFLADALMLREESVARLR